MWTGGRGGGGSTTTKSESNLLVSLVTFCVETSWTFKVDRKKLRPNLSYDWKKKFKLNLFGFNGELNCFGVIGVSDPIQIPWQTPWPPCLLWPYNCELSGCLYIKAVLINIAYKEGKARQVTDDRWQVTYNTWHMTHVTWHMTCDTG